MNLNRSCSFQGFYCLFVATGYDCSYLATFSLIPYSPHLWPRSPGSHTKGLAEINLLHCIKCDLPRGRFDWLKHGITASVAIFYAPTAMHQRSRFIIHIYTCSPWNIYTFTLFVYVSLLIYLPPAVFLIYVGRFACVFLLLSYSFFAAHLVEKSSRELMMEAGGEEKERENHNGKLYKDFL